MAKAKKRVAARKKSSKRGKANAKPARKLAAKQATSRKAKSKVKRTAMSAKKPVGKKKQPREPMETAKPIETTPMNVIDEPAPGVVAAAEHESAQIATTISTDRQLEPGGSLSPAGTSP